MHRPGFIKEFKYCLAEKGFKLMHDCSGSLLEYKLLDFLQWSVTMQSMLTSVIKHFNITQIIRDSRYCLINTQDGVLKGAT